MERVELKEDFEKLKNSRNVKLKSVEMSNIERLVNKLLDTKDFNAEEINAFYDYFRGQYIKASFDRELFEKKQLKEKGHIY